VALAFFFSNEEAGAGGLQYNAHCRSVRLRSPPRERLAHSAPLLQAGLASRSIQMQELTFGDQLIRGPQVSSIENRPSVAQHYFDFAAGMLVTGQYTWLGFSFDHSE